MSAKGLVRYQVKGNSGFEFKATRDKQLLENSIRQSVRTSYQGRAGEEWLQVCLRIVRHGVRMGKEGEIDSSDTDGSGPFTGRVI
jgi:hypothetical protein